MEVVLHHHFQNKFSSIELNPFPSEPSLHLNSARVSSAFAPSDVHHRTKYAWKWDEKKNGSRRLRSDTISHSFKPFIWIEITWRMLCVLRLQDREHRNSFIQHHGRVELEQRQLMHYNNVFVSEPVVRVLYAPKRNIFPRIDPPFSLFIVVIAIFLRSAIHSFIHW